MGILLLILLVLLVAGGLPAAPWPVYPHQYGYVPSGLGLVLLIVVVLILFGGLRF